MFTSMLARMRANLIMLVAGIVVGAVALGGITYVAAQSNNGNVLLCVNKNDQTLRVPYGNGKCPSGTQSLSVGGPGGTPPPQVTRYTTPGNYVFTVPAGAKALDVECVGGGGGGAGSNEFRKTWVGGGGGGGGYGEQRIASPASSYAVVVGLGGTAGIQGSTGGTGGSSLFGAALICSGGGGGEPGTNVSPGGGGPGGVATAGEFSIPGAPGGLGETGAFGPATPGDGGDSFMGSGGAFYSNGPGAGTGYGGGGAGWFEFDFPGAPGSGGLVIITTYF